MGEEREIRDLRPFLPWAIASMVLCFLPLGLVSVVYAVRSQSAMDAGEPELAVARRRVARRWAIAALVVGLLVDLVIVAFLLLLGAFGR